MCIYRLKTFGDYADIMNHKDYEINEAGGINGKLLQIDYREVSLWLHPVYLQVLI